MEPPIELVTKDEHASTEPQQGQDQPYGQARIEMHMEEEPSE
jgi:hypothetical protein